MQYAIAFLFSIYLLRKSIESQGISIGVIHNVSLWIFNTIPSIIHGSCQQCLCQLSANGNYSSFNCYEQNQTCQMYWQSDQNNSFQLIPSMMTTFYFVSLPLVSLTMTTVSMESTSSYSDNSCQGSSWSFPSSLWTFDSTFTDLSSSFNFTPINGSGFSSSMTITGYGASLLLNASRSQYLVMTSPFFSLSTASWTFELWIFMPSIINSSEYSLIGQCPAKLADRCLYMSIQSQRPYLGFFNDDLTINQVLIASRWYHLAFTFDCSTLNQSIYVNGISSNSRLASQSYQGDQGNLYIGYADLAYTVNTGYFNGFIDQLSYTNRNKSHSEILDDASLTVYLSFDNQSLTDSGPLRINASRVGSVNFTSGRVGDAVLINQISDSYVRLGGLVLLGHAYQPYSFSIWIQSNTRLNCTIVHLATTTTGTGWCSPLLVLTSLGQLIALIWAGSRVAVSGPIITLNNWIHVAVTYSSSNGLRLYVNGSLYNTSSLVSYAASNANNYLFLGSSLAGTSYCGGSPVFNGQYSGLVDEFRLYSREINSDDVFQLANS